MRVVLCTLLANVALANDPLVLIPLEGDPRDVRGVEKRVLDALEEKDRSARLFDRTMAELQTAAGCREDTPTCLGIIGREIGAREFVYGAVFNEGGRLSVLLRRFSVTEELEIGRAELTVRRPSSRNMRSLVSDVMKPADVSRSTAIEAFAATLGTLEVVSEVPDVLIRINGQPRGVAPLRLEDIGVATYDLEAEKTGYKKWRGQAAVEAGEVTTVRVTLEPLPQEQRALATADASFLKTRTWVVGGVAAALLSAGAVFAVLTASAQNDYDEQVRALRAGDPEAVQQAQALEADADSAENKALAANVLFAVGGATAIATAVLVLMDVSRGPEAGGAVSVQPGGVRIRF